MKKLAGAGLFTGAVLLLVFALGIYLPKYRGMLIWFCAFLLMQGGAWLSMRSWLDDGRKITKILLACVWLPEIILVLAAAFSLFLPFTEWPVAPRTWLLSLLLVFFTTKVFPLMAWLLLELTSMAVRVIPLVGRKPSGFHRPAFTGWFHRAGWSAGLIAGVLMLGGMVFGPYNFRVKEYHLSFKNLPASFHGFRIVQISDLHLGSWAIPGQLARAVKMVNSLDPDVIFVTGDMFNYRTSEGYPFSGILTEMKAGEGIFTITGNHDYGDYITWPDPGAQEQNFRDLITWYDSLGWTLLLNEHRFLVRGGDTIVVAGVENWGATRRFQRKGDIVKAISGTPPGLVHLVLSHDPSYWEKIISKHFPQVEAVFSGHTHGGQIGIISPFFRWSPVEALYPEWCGLYSNGKPGKGGQYILVNPGLGTIGYSGRIGIMPEISLVILR